MNCVRVWVGDISCEWMFVISFLEGFPLKFVIVELRIQEVINRFQSLYPVMFNLIGRIRFIDGKFCYFSSSPKSFLLQLHQFASSAANAPKFNSESSNHESPTAVYLKNGYGFSPKTTPKYSHERPDSIIAFLRKYRFNDSRISVIVRKWPLIFLYSPDADFVPKIRYLRSLGFSSLDIVKILTLAPSLLGRSLEGQITPCVDFIKSFLSCHEDFMSSITRSPRILESNLQETLLCNVGILRGKGVPDSHIAEFLKISPFGIASDPKSFRETVEKVQELGMNPQEKIFVIGVIVMREVRGLSWKEKMDVYKNWGWSENQVMDAFKKHPRIMAASKDKIAQIHDFLINKMSFDSSLLSIKPMILLLSLEKTIAPRCAFYQVLLSKGLIQPGVGLKQMLASPEKLFIGRYVQRYVKEAPDLPKIYKKIFTNYKM